MPLALMVAAVMSGATSLPELAASVDSLPVSRTAVVVGVSLQYLDWGGAGEALVFLPPACETPHIYGDIAPALASAFRVVGLTTRGCGLSSRAEAYDLDSQLRELEGFLDLLGVDRATIAGFSVSAGKAVRFARLFPSRVTRLVLFDPVYSYVAPGLEEQMAAAITALVGGDGGASPELFRRHHEAWELGSWSSALDRNLQESFFARPDGSLESRADERWWPAFRADMMAGRYFETHTNHPTLALFAINLERERLKQLDEATRVTLAPLIEDTESTRREQIEDFRESGRDIRIVEMPNTAHYCFVHRPEEVLEHLWAFLSAGRAR